MAKLQEPLPGDMNRMGLRKVLVKKLTLESSAVYRICVQGTLDQKCSDYLQGMTISTKHDESGPPVTILTGQLVDQAALLGVLETLYNLYHLPLLLVECVPFSGK
jgi:hypothetical protein